MPAKIMWQSFMPHSTHLEWPFIFITNTWSATWLQWSAPFWTSVLGSLLRIRQAALKKIAKSKMQSGKVSDNNLFLKSYNSGSHPATLEEIAITVIICKAKLPSNYVSMDSWNTKWMSKWRKLIVALENDAPKNKRRFWKGKTTKWRRLRSRNWTLYLILQLKKIVQAFNLLLQSLL